MEGSQQRNQRQQEIIADVSSKRSEVPLVLTGEGQLSMPGLLARCTIFLLSNVSCKQVVRTTNTTEKSKISPWNKGKQGKTIQLLLLTDD